MSRHGALPQHHSEPPQYLNGVITESIMPAAPASPSPWFKRHIHLIDASAPILDVACGRGRHTRWLHELGYRVVGVDIDLEGVRDLRTTPGLQLVQADLENGEWPFGQAGFGFGREQLLLLHLRHRRPEARKEVSDKHQSKCQKYKIHEHEDQT